MPRKIALLAVLLLPLALANCASVLEGTSQNIAVDTNPPGAHCNLKRAGEIIGAVNPTPGAVLIKKTKDDINVECAKAGYQDATYYIKSEIQGATWGNILAGGGIGWAIDSASGADNKYADHITVSMVPVGSIAPAPAMPLAGASSGNWRTKDAAPAYAEASMGSAATTFPKGTSLSLVHQQGSWGLFEYVVDGEKKARAWLPMDAVASG
ncbi:MAG: hypothetical protein AB7N54_08230 [Alphaproteobacteria bacterium]